MTAPGVGMNTTSPGILALNVNGDTLLSMSLNVAGITTINNNTKLFSLLE
jgi:hypothetical protein